jgi:site-specific DNA recombinase
MLNYFLYVRKSTDVEDKQVRSIDDQLAVLRVLSKTEGLNIVNEFIEKQSAKRPGRPVFGEMLSRLEKGEAQGIVCWKLDRLARNPIDGGQISWFLQKGTIQHIQTHDRSYRPTDNTLVMSMEFGMANQFIIDLSANTKRGLHEKVRRGEYPSRAPLGYLNDVRTKRIVVERKTAKVVIAAFELYAKGNSRLEDISVFFAKNGVRADTGNIFKRGRISRILSDVFYCGLFKYAGETYEGTHESIISKKLFDLVQTVLADRGKPHNKTKNEPQPLCGLFRCGECGCSITAEKKIKKQVCGKIHNYIYYRCTKKRGSCSQPHIRDGELIVQLSDVLKEYALPSDWAAELSARTDEDAKKAAQLSATVSQEMRDKVATAEAKLQRLLTAYLDQDIEREAYLTEKASLLSRKKSLEEKIVDLKRGSIAWLEPMREWIKDAVDIGENAISSSLLDKKSSAVKISGSNLFLKDKKIQFVPIKPYASLREARKKFLENESCFSFERVRGVEPLSSAWKAGVIPIYDTRLVIFEL